VDSDFLTCYRPLNKESAEKHEKNLVDSPGRGA
jgi:hypothetical protein